MFPKCQVSLFKTSPSLFFLYIYIYYRKHVFFSQFLQENSKDPSRGFGTADLQNFVGVTDPNRIRCSTGSALLGSGGLVFGVGNQGRILIAKKTVLYLLLELCWSLPCERMFSMNELM